MRHGRSGSRKWRTAWLVGIVAVMLTSALSLQARTVVTLTGDDIPATYAVGSQLLFDKSDSLYLNRRLLTRGKEYQLDLRRGIFDLSSLTTTKVDTLVIIYRKVPRWALGSFGHTVPDLSGGRSKISRPSQARPSSDLYQSPSDLTIAGTKTFRFSSRTQGTSDFGQSIDLKISGDVTPGLRLTGTVSDRGYNPSYGTTNSRLSELDKISLALTSKTFRAAVGDISIASRFESKRSKRQVSGLAVQWQTDRNYFQATAARPRGRFETSRFVGRDGTQGPYQIAGGAAARPVVPGSERVWLDGQLLQRGANKDYVMDYAAGRVVFNVNHPLDKRSRIEIDYEPLATDFKGELFSVGGGAAWEDSTFFAAVEWLREGDDQDEPVVGELLEADRALLEGSGDNTLAAVRSGVTVDSNGSYLLIDQNLPDSNYQFVGPGNGAYEVRFSYVGAGPGEYLFVGNSNYEFVGAGSGDYLPIVIVKAPRRTDHYGARFGLHNRYVGSLTAEVRRTEHDANLLSDLDDHDNQGSLYDLRAERKFGEPGTAGSLGYQFRRREATFQQRERLNQADFGREFFLPEGVAFDSDETLQRFDAAVTPVHPITIKTTYSRLEYQDQFKSKIVGGAADVRLNKELTLSAGAKKLEADLTVGAVNRLGEANLYSSRLEYRLNRGWTTALTYTYDRRVNDFSGTTQGTRLNEYRTALSRPDDTFEAEFMVEDTLVGTWRRSLERWRLSTFSERRLGQLRLTWRGSYQSLRANGSKDESFLGRVNYQYRSAVKRLDLSGRYAISEETRNARGISYLEVDPGTGNYIFEDGQYVPDPEGNFIKTDEILSDRQAVRRGEKSFRLNKSWQLVTVRISSDIEEELLPAGERKIWWLLPFLSDENERYLFYRRRYDADVRLWPLRVGHAVNLALGDDLEIRDVAGLSRLRRETSASAKLRQIAGIYFVEESVELFRLKRDQYFSGGGDVDGYRLAISVRRQGKRVETSVGGAYRRADGLRDERSEIYTADLGANLRLIRRGELRSALELYSQKLSGLSGVPSYSLTGNRPGKRGARWSVAINYGLKKSMKVKVSLTGRHADTRTGRVTARGEFIAEF